VITGFPTAKITGKQIMQFVKVVAGNIRLMSCSTGDVAGVLTLMSDGEKMSGSTENG
jgi:hypothetical protein